MSTTFLVPHFDKSQKDKVNNLIGVISPHVLVMARMCTPVPAISAEGFPSNRDGTYVFVASIEKTVRDSFIYIGYTSTATVDANANFVYCGKGFNGAVLDLFFGDKTNELPAAKTNKSKEIIAILTISKNGCKKEIQFIVDGHEGKVHELAETAFEGENGGSEIFCVVTLAEKHQQIEFIPYGQVRSHSPKIDELMREFLSSENNNNNNNSEKQEETLQQTTIKKAVKKVVVAPSKLKVETKKTEINKIATKDTKEKSPTKKKTAKKETTPTKKTGKTIAKK